jgi:hypothetical protein
MTRGEVLLVVLGFVLGGTVGPALIWGAVWVLAVLGAAVGVLT